MESKWPPSGRLPRLVGSTVTEMSLARPVMLDRNTILSHDDRGGAQVVAGAGVEGRRGGASGLPSPWGTVAGHGARPARGAVPGCGVRYRVRDSRRPGWSPGRLALVTVLQRVENLTDRQAADAVRDKISWKYALGLGLDDEGFDASVLSEFCTRVVEHGLEQRVLDLLLDALKTEGLVGAGGKARTDSTHVIPRCAI